jgi:hypothetical protein
MEVRNQLPVFGETGVRVPVTRIRFLTKPATRIRRNRCSSTCLTHPVSYETSYPHSEKPVFEYPSHASGFLRNQLPAFREAGVRVPVSRIRFLTKPATRIQRNRCSSTRLAHPVSNETSYPHSEKPVFEYLSRASGFLRNQLPAFRETGVRVPVSRIRFLTKPATRIRRNRCSSIRLAHPFLTKPATRIRRNRCSCTRLAHPVSYETSYSVFRETGVRVPVSRIRFLTKPATPYETSYFSRSPSL